jgi:hypothetical protein
MADIFRSLGDAYRGKHANPLLSTGQDRVMDAIEACRTAVLGGHVEQCADWGNSRIAYNSCCLSKIVMGVSSSFPLLDVALSYRVISKQGDLNLFPSGL